MRKLLLAFTMLLAPLFAQAAHAEVENPWTTWAGAGWLFFEQDEEQEGGQQYEIRQGYDMNEDWTLEAGFNGGPFYEGRDLIPGRSFEGGENWSLGANAALLYHLAGNPAAVGNPEGEFDPYAGVHGGIRWYKKELDDGHWVPNGGVQAGTNYYINDRWALRGDYRLEVAGSDTEFNHHVMAYVGYRWGGAAEVTEGVATSRAEGGIDRAGLELQTVYFPFDSDELTPAARDGLRQNAEWLKQNPEKRVILEGHCDERGTNEYNLGLGQRRAQSAHDYLRSLGVESDRMETISYGEERPAVQGSNEEAWAKNRRVECVVKE